MPLSFWTFSYATSAVDKGSQVAAIKPDLNLANQNEKHQSAA
jgi:hypothetical protein